MSVFDDIKPFLVSPIIHVFELVFDMHIIQISEPSINHV